MTREEAKAWFKVLLKDEYAFNSADREAFAMAIKALEQEPCEDAISRRAVEKITWEEPSYSDALNVLTEVRDKVRALPPVNPQPKTGHWIRVDKDKLRCTKCDVIHFIGQYPQGKIAWCPNCGAKMESENKK